MAVVCILENIQVRLFCFTAVDIVGPLTESHDMKYIVTSVCYFMKYVEAKAIPNKVQPESC